MASTIQPAFKLWRAEVAWGEVGVRFALFTNEDAPSPMFDIPLPIGEDMEWSAW